MAGGKLSFATMEEGGVMHCEAALAEGWKPNIEAQRAIRVPFHVTSDSVEIASISDGVTLEWGRLGACALMFETSIDAQSEMQARFIFVPVSEVVAPAILKADSSLQPPKQLRMVARPA